MNEALILLLVIFIHSQSDGILVPNPNTNHHFQDSQLEGWDGGEFPYAEDINENYKKRSLTNDAFTRRSALDKNFMRFGRGSEAPQEQRRQRLYSAGKLAFYRFVRGLKDNFIRFGRGGEKSGFIRFGRTRPEDFFRAGKSLRENFIRFGKADKNFMRFGREGNDPNCQESLFSEEPFQSTDLSKIQDNFTRFVRASKNATSFFDLDDLDENDQDSAFQKEIKRRRRRTQQEHPMRPPTLIDFTNRNSNGPFQFFHFLPENFPGRISPGLNGSWQNFQVLNPSRLTQFYPVFPNLLKQTNPFGSATKRDRGNSNFIRFG